MSNIVETALISSLHTLSKFIRKVDTGQAKSTETYKEASRSCELITKALTDLHTTHSFPFPDTAKRILLFGQVRTGGLMSDPAWLVGTYYEGRGFLSTEGAHVSNITRWAHLPQNPEI